MAEARVERRLAAILAADVAGYSRMMGQDEAGTLAALKMQRSGLIEPTIAKHSGRVVKLMGDGILAEFSSVVEAALCATEIQREMARRPSPKGMQLRIGLHLGDIIIEGEDIYGDGVKGSPSPVAFAFHGRRSTKSRVSCRSRGGRSGRKH